MIVRFVKLSIIQEKIPDFKQLTENERGKILTFPGCFHLELFQDVNNACVFFTVSHWESESALDTYRNSDFFKGNWHTVKQWFSSKPEAWSLVQTSSV